MTRPPKPVSPHEIPKVKAEKDPNRETCEMCRFYRRGTCHYDPPVRYLYAVVATTYDSTAWPKVSLDDWCGRYQK